MNEREVAKVSHQRVFTEAGLPAWTEPQVMIKKKEFQAYGRRHAAKLVLMVDGMYQECSRTQ